MTFESMSRRSGPVSGPPVTGSWQRDDLTVTIDPCHGGRWQQLGGTSHSWLNGHPGRELFGEADALGWVPQSETTDRLDQPSGSDGLHVATSTGGLTRTVHELSGAVRVGYRIAARAPWWHGLELPLRTSPEARIAVPATSTGQAADDFGADDHGFAVLAPSALPAVFDEGLQGAGLVGVSGWAHLWVLDGTEALGLHWTTEQRTDVTLMALRAALAADGSVLVAPMVGTEGNPIPPRRDFAWRLVLTAWRSR